MQVSHATVNPRADFSGLWANSGGPCSRSRCEVIRSTVLGSRKGNIRCPRRLGLALDFESSDPWEVMKALLAARGVADPEGLRVLFPDIPGPMLASPSGSLRALKVSAGSPDAVLRQALLLGLCTSVFYDPSRPVIWTRSSLTRKLSLFATAGFYA